MGWGGGVIYIYRGFSVFALITLFILYKKRYTRKVCLVYSVLSITLHHKCGETVEILMQIINRPCVAGAVLQSPPYLINSVSDLIVKIWSKHSQSQTGRAMKLKFWENVDPTLCVMWHVSYVTCHMSPVTCHLLPITYKKKIILFFFLFKKRPLLSF